MSHQTHFLLATYTKTSANALDDLKSFGSNAWEGATSMVKTRLPRFLSNHRPDAEHVYIF
jgi:hypothetical protein